MNLIQCERDDTARMTPSTCIARQKILAKGTGRNSWIAVQYRDCVNTCLDCQTGLELYEKHLKEQKEKPMKEKRCSRKDCLKLLPATVEFFPANKTNNDGLSYYCKECSAKLAKIAYQKKVGKAEPKEVVVAKSEPIPQKVDPAPVKKTPQVKTFRCSVCKKDKELTLDNFHQNLTKTTGFDSTCRVCRNEKKRAARGTGEFVVKIDFTNHQEFFGKLQEKAVGQLRTIENQALKVA